MRIGTRLDLRAANGEIRKLVLLGPWESTPEAGIYSYESDLGQALLGKKVGDLVQVEEIEYTLAVIAPYA